MSLITSGRTMVGIADAISPALLISPEKIMVPQSCLMLLSGWFGSSIEPVINCNRLGLNRRSAYKPTLEK